MFVARPRHLCHILAMRLSERQIETIRKLIRTGFGADARACVFGSRTDDTAIGGDIDLLIEVPEEVTLAHEISLSAQLELQLGEPVDILTTWPGQRYRPIVEVARLTGVPL